MAEYINFQSIPDLGNLINTQFLHIPNLTKEQLYRLLYKTGKPPKNFCQHYPPDLNIGTFQYSVRYIALHTTASCNAAEETRKKPSGEASVRETIRFHYCDKKEQTDAYGWKRPGYAFFIALDGIIYQILNIRNDGFIDQYTSSYGINSEFNSCSIHIVYDGGHKKCKPYVAADTRTPEQLHSMELLVRWLLDKFPNTVLIGHNQADAKSMPHVFMFQHGHAPYGIPSSR